MVVFIHIMLSRIANILVPSTVARSFSSMNNPQPSEFSKDLVIIRHAQSDFNKGFMDFKQLKNMNMMSWDECTQNE